MPVKNSYTPRSKAPHTIAFLTGTSQVGKSTFVNTYLKYIKAYRTEKKEDPDSEYGRSFFYVPLSAREPRALMGNPSWNTLDVNSKHSTVVDIIHSDNIQTEVLKHFLEAISKHVKYLQDQSNIAAEAGVDFESFTVIERHPDDVALYSEAFGLSVEAVERQRALINDAFVSLGLLDDRYFTLIDLPLLPMPEIEYDRDNDARPPKRIRKVVGKAIEKIYLKPSRPLKNFADDQVSHRAADNIMCRTVGSKHSIIHQDLSKAVSNTLTPPMERVTALHNAYITGCAADLIDGAFDFLIGGMAEALDEKLGKRHLSIDEAVKEHGYLSASFKKAVAEYRVPIPAAVIANTLDYAEEMDANTDLQARKLADARAMNNSATEQSIKEASKAFKVENYASVTDAVEGTDRTEEVNPSTTLKSLQALYKKVDTILDSCLALENKSLELESRVVALERSASSSLSGADFSTLIVSHGRDIQKITNEVDRLKTFMKGD
jgi:hypothetical protein